jgi:hypothetical protein
MPRFPFRAPFWWLATVLVGCGQVHGIPVDKTASDIGQTVCSAAYRCCSVAQLMGNDAAGTDAGDCSADSSACEQACETKTTDKFRNVLVGIQASVDQKRAVYEQAKVDACLQTIRSAACGTLNMTGRLEGVPGCGSFVTPLVALGGACGNDYECLGSWCKHDPASQSFDGVCTAFAAVAEACGDEARCASDLRCDPKTKDPADDVCVTVGSVGAACSDASECQSGVCSGSEGSGKTCAEPAGNQCFYASGCAAAGDNRLSVPTLLLFVAFAAVALARTRRQSKGR